MTASAVASRVLTQEALSMLYRLGRLQPFAMHMPMVPAAGIPLTAQTAIEQHLAKGKRKLRKRIYDYLSWLHGPQGANATPEEAQRRFTLLRMEFNAILSQFDIFADALTQRSEHDNGIWLAGLDTLAADALSIPGNYYEVPPVICYLDRGFGAAIRRARTRLPGGGENPVAIIRVPRERMIGSGIASSLVHEVGHQASVLLDLINPLRIRIQEVQNEASSDRAAWVFWERWISEILADLWSVAKIGLSSTFGLMGVVSLPYPFVFRGGLDDPHPIPWIRVMLSCSIGHALYPHAQWKQLAEIWGSFYPLYRLIREKRRLMDMLQANIPGFIGFLMDYRPKSLRGRSLKEVMSVEERQPRRLDASYEAWYSSPAAMRRMSPTLAFAAVGQAKIRGKISPEEEGQIIADLLKYWALSDTLDVSAACAALSKPRAVALVT